MGTTESKENHNKIINVNADSLINVHNEKKDILQDIETNIIYTNILILTLLVFFMCYMFVNVVLYVKRSFVKKVKKLIPEPVNLV